MLRPGLHFGNTSAVTDADLDIIRRWSPLSLLLAMNNIVEDSQQINRLKYAWELGGKPELVVRRYFQPKESSYSGWGKHADESVKLAERCINVGIPVGKLILKPFNEPNMPTSAMNQPYGEGFGDKPEQISKYNEALHRFIDVVREKMPGLRIGGPHLTVGNRDARMGQDPQAEYYYHGPDGKFVSSRCYGALIRLDCHFVHCYGMRPGEHLSPYHGLRFVEYCKYMGTQKPVYIVEGTYGLGSGEPWTTDQARGRETVEYLKELDKYPYVKGIALWIGGDRGWDAFRFSDGNTHRPVVFAIEKACKEGSVSPPPPPPPPPPPDDEIEFVGLSAEMIEALEITGPEDATQPYWAIKKVEVQPKTDHQSAFAVIMDVSRELARFYWDGEGHECISKADPYAPIGAKENAASFPMFEAWGSYGVRILGNSQNLRGFGLYGADLNPAYKAHHPVLVYFQLVEPEPEEEEPMPEYTFLKGLEAHRIKYIDHRSDVLGMMADNTLVPLVRSKTDPIGSVKGIIVHHSAQYMGIDPKPMDIASYHIKTNRWPGCAYTFIITKNGIVHFMMPIKCVGYHSGNSVVNYASVGVCFIGDFTKEEPTVEQLASFNDLRAALEELFGGGWDKWRDVWVAPHKWINATQCPGQNLERALLWY